MSGDLQIVVLVGSVIASCVVWSKRRFVYENCVVIVILIHCESFPPCRYYFERTEGFWQ